MERDYKTGTKALAAAGLILVTIIWGGSFVVMKSSVDKVPPGYLLAIRFTAAAVAMMAAFPKSLRRLNKESLHNGILVGIILELSYLFQTYGIKYTTASKNAFITALYVILVPFLSWTVNGKKPGINNLLAAVLAIAGLGLLTLRGVTAVNFGDFLTFLCSISFTVHLVLAERYTKNQDPILLATLQVAVVAALNWILAPFLDGFQAFSFEMLRDKALVLGILYLAIFCTMAAYAIQMAGQKILSANASSLLLSLEAVFGTIFSVIFLKEVLTGKMIVGCVLMFFALVISGIRFETHGKEVHG